MNEVATKPPAFSLVPQTMTEALELAKLIADSDLAPKDYRNKPGNVLIAVQMGQEIGLSAMSAIQSIAVINGKPSLYGDVGKALLLANGCIIEEDDIEVIRTTGMGRCKITRPGRPPTERKFSVASAKTAKLWGKSGPWTDYPERQMAWRAFWFAARDAASDLLKGLSGAEELADYPAERDMGTAEVITTTSTKPALPAYTDDMFAADKPGMVKALPKKSADQLIAMISTKFVLSDEHKAAIRALAEPPKTNTPATSADSSTTNDHSDFVSEMEAAEDKDS